MSIVFSRARGPLTCPSRRRPKFETVVNLKTAKAINLEIPGSVLVRADEVIE